MRIRDKILIGFLLVALLGAGVGALQYIRLKGMIRPFREDIPRELKDLRQAVSTDTLAQRIRYFDEVLTHSLARYIETDNVWWEQRFRAYRSQMEDTLKQAVALSDEQSRPLFGEIQTLNAELMALSDQAAAFMKNSEPLRARQLIKSAAYWQLKGGLDEKLRAYLAKYAQQNTADFEISIVGAKTVAHKAETALQNSLKIALILLVGGLAVALLLGLLLASSIAGPLEKLTGFAAAIGQGDFDKRVELSSKDEVGRLAGAFNKMLADLSAYREKLVRTEKLAAMGKLAGIIGHEIRAPLAVMRNTTYLLRKKIKTPAKDITRYLNMIDEEVENANMIIEDTLDFARAKEPQLKAGDITGLLEKVLKKKSLPSGIRLVKDFDRDMPPVLFDEGQMFRVYYNLVMNAIQAMEAKGTLTLRAKLKDAPKADFIETTVEDTGPGIAPDQQQKIFEPLFTTKQGGTGLGLAVCRNIIEAHKGTLTLKSEAGQGAAFIITLPCAPRQQGGRR